MVAPVIAEDLERLASRLALLTSDDGEADNAGRAAGQLARRLGLSGGQIKAIFLAGVEAAGVRLPPAESEADALPADRGETEELRRLLDRADAERAGLQQELAGLQDENDALREALGRTRVTGRVLRVAGVVVGLALAAAAAAVWLAPAWHSEAIAPAAGRMARAGLAGADLFRAPDLAAESAGHLAAGTPLPVSRVLWHGLSQWVETRADGRAAFAPVTQVDLR